MGKKAERIEVIDGKFYVVDEEETALDTLDDDLKPLTDLVRSGKDQRAIKKHRQRKGVLPPGSWGAGGTS